MIRGPASCKSGGISSFLSTLVREPFLHFVLLGGLIFGLMHYIDERARITRITITQSQINKLTSDFRLQHGALPTPPQLQALVDNFVKEQIFFRQALKLGLEVDDEIIRRRLVQKYEFLQQDLAIPAEPGSSQLHEYYRLHMDRYVRPATVTFAHAYFSPDARGDDGAREAAQALASELNRHGIDVRIAGHGDRFPGKTDFAAVSRDAVDRVFGSKGLAEEVFNVEVNRWSAPLRSGLGWHTVYITARQPARTMPYEAIQESVRLDYLAAERERRNTMAFERLRKNFRIVRE